MSLVVDASTTIRWFFRDQRDALSVAALRYIRSHGAVVPCIWSTEVCHVLVKYERRGRVQREQSAVIIARLRRLPVHVEPGGNEPSFPQFSLARKYQLSAYDATYLELACRLGLHLMTHDERLADAAAHLEVLWRPPARRRARVPKPK